MKKSGMRELLARTLGLGHPSVTAVLTEMEARGHKWDPEEEPLPERLKIGEGFIRWSSDGISWIVAKISLQGHAPIDPHEIAEEAVRRWNAWPELRRLVNDWQCSEGFAGRLLAILDGEVKP